jgi:hypothetical protein
MTWSKLLENPQAVTNLFDSGPSLEDVEITSLTMERDGPTIAMSILLREFPTKPSPRWKRNGVNAVLMRLQLLQVESITVEGWSILNRATITLDRGNADQVQVRAAGQKLRLKCTCGWLRVDGVNGYHRAEDVR